MCGYHASAAYRARVVDSRQLADQPAKDGAVRRHTSRPHVGVLEHVGERTPANGIGRLRPLLHDPAHGIEQHGRAMLELTRRSTISLMAAEERNACDDALIEKLRQGIEHFLVGRPGRRIQRDVDVPHSFPQRGGESPHSFGRILATSASLGR